MRNVLRSGKEPLREHTEFVLSGEGAHDFFY